MIQCLSVLIVRQHESCADGQIISTNKNKQQKQQQHTEKPPPPQPPLESRPNQELLVKQAFNTGTHCQPKEQAQIEKTENG